MNFGELKNEVLLNVIDTPTAIQTLVPRYVNRAVRTLMQKHDYKTMESQTQLITTNLTRELGVRPNDWKKPRGKPYFTENSGRVRDLVWVSNRSDGQYRWGDSTQFDYGWPQGLYENDLSSTFEVFPYPDQLSDWPDGNYRITIPYWKYLGTLVADSDTNWFTDNADEWVTLKATATAFFANEDEMRGQLWEARAQAIYKDIILLDKTRRLGETQTLAIHVGARRPHTQE